MYHSMASTSNCLPLSYFMIFISNDINKNFKRLSTYIHTHVHTNIVLKFSSAAI